MALTLCSACDRHLRTTEVDCPFCGARLSRRGKAAAETERVGIDGSRVSRALLVFGTLAVLGASAEACAPNEPAPAPPVSPVAMYGAPPPMDPSAAPPSAPETPDAASSPSAALPPQDGPSMALLYGAPPMATEPLVDGGPKKANPKKR